MPLPKQQTYTIEDIYDLLYGTTNKDTSADSDRANDNN